MKIETRQITQYGLTVDGTWVPYSDLEELEGVHGQEGFATGASFSGDIEKTLIRSGLAHESTRGSLFPNMPKFRELMESIEF